ncbi:SdpI family protein [Halolamina sp. CBA1230]|uniref:SdpI family protein n=1 Tax=Halolamina sp. CBA1230 TaxID=1853690 RepID=UPI0009A20B5D|nr:SdpI family protein [Halolamina sp. CBA1230]QKY19299.1 SdpI family protein [Halolamina sp. CBA1230]
MDTSRRFGLAGVIVALAAAAGLLVAPDLPAEMATHWNPAGEPDATLSKPIALGLVPGLTALLLGALYVLPRVDPKGENIERFRATYDWFVVGLAATLSVVHVGIVAYNLGYRFPFVSLVLVAVAGLLYAAGVVLERAEQNWVVGIRTPWTLESEAVWERTHAVGATLFKLTALAVLLGAVFPQFSMLLLVGPLVVTTVALTVYPYLLYRRLEAE